MARWHKNKSFKGLYTRYPQPADFSFNVPPYKFIDFSRQQFHELQCIHEAGHAVLSVAFGIPVISVRVEGSEGGRIIHPDGVSFRVLNLVLKCAGGERAADRWLREQKLHTSKRGWTLEKGSENCRAKAADYVRKSGRLLMFGGRPMSAKWSSKFIDYKDACDEADKELGSRWPAVMAVAQELERHGTVTGDRVVEIVNRYGKR